MSPAGSRENMNDQQAPAALTLTPIGYVRNDVEELLPPAAIKAVESRIVIYPEFGDGLEGLEGGQRLLVLFHFNRLSGYELRQHPHNDPQLPKRGVFALHSPRRPNPIGVTEVDLLRREGNELVVRGLDAVNGTPVLDLKLNK
jgi:tRNA (adenine37-N6)-methyltransferase